MNILNAMHDAKFVRFNNQILETQYSPDPDGTLVDDDIVLEASADEGSLELSAKLIVATEQTIVAVVRLVTKHRHRNGEETLEHVRDTERRKESVSVFPLSFSVSPISLPSYRCRMTSSRG